MSNTKQASQNMNQCYGTVSCPKVLEGCSISAQTHKNVGCHYWGILLMYRRNATSVHKMFTANSTSELITTMWTQISVQQTISKYVLEATAKQI